MTEASPIPEDTQLTVLYRVEPGCLGPDGKTLVEEFCQYAHSGFQLLNIAGINWQVVPRYDKSLVEIEYQLNGKKLTNDQADQCLERLGRELDDFEIMLGDRLASMIDRFTR